MNNTIPICTLSAAPIIFKSYFLPKKMIATLRGNVRKLRLPMCGGTPFAVVSIQGEIMNWCSGRKKENFTDALKEGRERRQGMQEMLSD